MNQHASRSPREVAVYGPDDRFMSHCSAKRAQQMVNRQKAVVIAPGKVKLLVTKKTFRETRKQACIRDNYTCYICERKVTDTPELYPDLRLATVDHVRPRAMNGSDTLENIACCCVDCNMAKGELSVEEFIALMLQQMSLVLIRYNVPV